MRLSPAIGVELESETCCVCATLFAMSSILMAKRREDKEGFFCPNGHKQFYVKSEAERLREELAKEKADHLFQRNRAVQNSEWLGKREEQIARLKKAIKRAKVMLPARKGTK